MSSSFSFAPSLHLSATRGKHYSDHCLSFSCCIASLSTCMLKWSLFHFPWLWTLWRDIILVYPVSCDLLFHATLCYWDSPMDLSLLCNILFCSYRILQFNHKLSCNLCYDLAMFLSLGASSFCFHIRDAILYPCAKVSLVHVPKGRLATVAVLQMWDCSIAQDDA